PRNGRGGRTGTPGDLIARGSSPPARDGLGRGGNGVDPLPLGVPVIDPDNPYDMPGPPAFSPGQRGRGGDPRSGQSSGPTSLVPGSRGGGDVPGFGPRPGLIPVDPEKMPGLDHPGSASGGSPSTPTTAPARNRSSVAGTAPDSNAGNLTAGRSGSV